MLAPLLLKWYAFCLQQLWEKERVFKKDFSVIVHLLFMDGTHSSAAGVQVWLWAPVVFLQTKLLAFLLSISFRDIYF